MNINKLGEFGLIDQLKRFCPTGKNVIKSIGDDTAILAYTKDKYQLFTTDMMAEGVHFTKRMPAKAIGHKALACNISDIAAMGGLPTMAVVSIGLPPQTPLAWIKDVYQGIGNVARRFGVGVVGGDTIKSNKAIINIALLGEVYKKDVVTRSGAKAGDSVFVTGKLGGSFKSNRHLTFTPRVEQAQFLVKHVKPSAMIDISDGLAQDLNHMLKLSKVGVRLEEAMIPCHHGVTLKQALSDGEDYELLFTLNPKKTAWLMQWQTRNHRWFFYPIGTIITDQRKCLNEQGFKHF